MVPLTLAVATDALLKNEFDTIRGNDDVHPLWKEYGLNVRAFDHPNIDIWRSNFKGCRVLHAETNLEIFGAVDDVWQNRNTGELHIVDYKSTSNKGDPTIDGGGWSDSYKRQMEIYQWLFRQSGFEVSNTGYFLYVNGSKEGTFYDATLGGIMRFSTTLIPYEGDGSWLPDILLQVRSCLEGEVAPGPSENCDICSYFSSREILEVH